MRARARSLGAQVRAFRKSGSARGKIVVPKRARLSDLAKAGLVVDVVRRPLGQAGKAKLYVVLSDVHVPYEDKNAISAVCDLMRDLEPDGLVLNGDVLDLIELSRHSSNSVAQLEGLRVSKTFDAANAFLDQLEEAGGPKMADKRFIDGNHCDRLRRWLATSDNAVWIGDEATSIAKRLRFKERGFLYLEGYPEAYTKLGHLVVTHGRWTSKYAAATHLDRYRRSVLVGHCHTPGMQFGPGLEKQQAGFVQGHLADVRSKAMSYAPVPNSWRTGFSLVYVEPNENFHVTLIQFTDGRFFYGGRMYGGKR